MFILELILRAGGDPRSELTTRSRIPERNNLEKITRVLSSKETRSVGVYLPRRSLTSARSRPLRRPRVAPTLLPVRATNPLRPRFTLSPYLIPLNPQLPPWLLTEHDSLRTALVINNSPALRSASPAAGHRASPHRLTVACVEPQLTPRFPPLSPGVCLLHPGRSACRTFYLLATALERQPRLAVPTKQAPAGLVGRLMLPHPRCHMVSFVPDALLSATLPGN